MVLYQKARLQVDWYRASVIPRILATARENNLRNEESKNATTLFAQRPDTLKRLIRRP